MQISKIFLIVSLIAAHGLRASNVQKQLDAPTNTVVVHKTITLLPVTAADILRTLSCAGVSKEVCMQVYLQVCANTESIREGRDRFEQKINFRSECVPGIQCTEGAPCSNCRSNATKLESLNRIVNSSEAIEEKLKSELEKYKK